MIPFIYRNHGTMFPTDFQNNGSMFPHDKNIETIVPCFLLINWNHISMLPNDK